MSRKPCPFCAIVRGEIAAAVVYEDEVAIAFLDKAPLLRGHALLVPRTHYETLLDVPPAALGPLFAAVQRLAGAVERALKADGVFTAINVRISQSVPHLHVHVMPRWKDDKLFSRNFAWVRRPYPSEVAREEVRALIAAAVQS